MNIIKNFDENFNKIDLDKYMTLKYYVIFLLICYISIVSIYTPRNIIKFVNEPKIKLLLILAILCVSHYDITMGIFAAIAFIVTMILNNSLNLAEKSLLENFNLAVDNDNDKEKYKREEFNDGDDDDTSQADETDSEEEDDDESDSEEEDSEDSIDSDDEEESDGE